MASPAAREASTSLASGASDSSTSTSTPGSTGLPAQNSAESLAVSALSSGAVPVATAAALAAATSARSKRPWRSSVEGIAPAGGNPCARAAFTMSCSPRRRSQVGFPSTARFRSAFFT